MEPGDAPQSICHTNLISGRWSQWSVSGVSALSLSLCGFIMAWLVSLTWNLNKVELEVPSFLPVNLTRPAETINADHNPSGSDPSRPTAVFKLGASASLPVPGEVSVGRTRSPGPPFKLPTYRDSSTPPGSTVVPALSYWPPGTHLSD